MIVRPRRGFLPLLLTLQGSVLPAVMPQVILVASLAAAAFAVHEIYPNYFPNYGLAPFSILGLMLSLLLGFRNNASYARWWEARQQLGSLLVQCRALARLSMSYLVAAPHIQQRCMLLIRAFSRALLYELRSRPLQGALDELLDEQELWSNLVYEHQAVFLSDCSITCSPSWNLTLLTTRVSS